MTGGGYMPGFKNGKLSITERQKEILETTLPELDELSSIIKSVGGQRRTFVTAMSWLLNFSSANKNRLMKCVREKYSLIRPVADKFSLLRDLEDIYNKNIRTPGNRVYFEAEYKEYLISRENQK